MKKLIQVKPTTSLIVITFSIACLMVCSASNAFGVVPAPDGGYANYNTAEGQNALFSLTTGAWNTALGALTLYSDTTGTGNTAVGINVLRHNVTGALNTAVGLNALYSNVGGPNMGNGNENSAFGSNALFSNISGLQNCAFGSGALASSANDVFNTAIGYHALNSNNGGASNTAMGGGALAENTTGVENTASGALALLSNTTGNNNTATGANALFDNSTGTNNVAVGFQALQNNTIGSNNIALGLNAGQNLTTGNGNVDIGNGGIAGEFATTRIGAVQTRTFISGIRGVTTGNADAIPVVIDSLGQLGTMSSSRRFKKEIKPMDKASESLLALRPVTFHYKSDKTKRPEFGLVAEEVAEVNPDLVVCDKNGEIYTVRYDAVNAMLLNEFLKEHRTVQQQEATIAQLKKDFQATVAQLTARLDQQTSQIQKVSAQLELNKPAPQTVLNNQ